jgi:magnesium transporter
LITILLHRNGRSERVSSLDRSWLDPAAGCLLWVDLASPSIPESLILSDTFGFHPLSVEDAMSARQYPKVESYEGYLYVILHEIEWSGPAGFSTRDVDFLVGGNYLVTVHDGSSSCITDLREQAEKNAKMIGGGPVMLLHRIVDAMVDHYRPEIEKLDDRIGELEEEAFQEPTPALVREILRQKHAVSALRRIVTPERDVIARLARREFADISVEMAFRFRDVYDHLVRLADDVLIFHERLTGILEAHLSNVSNRLNEVMKVLTIVATIFMPLTLLTGAYGMNVALPQLPGGDAGQFWWLAGIMTAIVAVMLAVFRRKGWI